MLQLQSLSGNHSALEHPPSYLQNNHRGSACNVDFVWYSWHQVSTGSIEEVQTISVIALRSACFPIALPFYCLQCMLPSFRCGLSSSSVYVF